MILVSAIQCPLHDSSSSHRSKPLAFLGLSSAALMYEHSPPGYVVLDGTAGIAGNEMLACLRAVTGV